MFISFRSRCKSASANVTLDQQLKLVAHYYLLTKTVLALPLEDVGPGGLAPHKHYRASVQVQAVEAVRERQVEGVL
jgi:hypothetical protein